MVKTKGMNKGLGRASSSTSSQPFVSRHHPSQLPTSRHRQAELDDQSTSSKPVPLSFMSPLALQPYIPYIPPSETLALKRSPKTPPVVDQDQPDPVEVEIEFESSPSESLTHEAPPIEKESTQAFNDPMYATSDAIIEGMTEMTPPDELNSSSHIPTPTPAFAKRVKHMATKKTPSWLLKRAPTVLTKFPIVGRR